VSGAQPAGDPLVGTLDGTLAHVVSLCSWRAHGQCGAV